MFQYIFVSKSSLKYYIFHVLCYILYAAYNITNESKILSEFGLRRCRSSNRLSLVKLTKNSKNDPTDGCKEHCCDVCPDEGNIRQTCSKPPIVDWKPDWDEDMGCDEWKHVKNYHLWGYT